MCEQFSCEQTDPLEIAERVTKSKNWHKLMAWLKRHVFDREEYQSPPLPLQATQAGGGTEEKVAVMEKRFAAGEQLKHPRDPDDSPFATAYKARTGTNGRDDYQQLVADEWLGGVDSADDLFDLGLGHLPRKESQHE